MKKLCLLSLLFFTLHAYSMETIEMSCPDKEQQELLIYNYTGQDAYVRLKTHDGAIIHHNAPEFTLQENPEIMLLKQHTFLKILFHKIDEPLRFRAWSTDYLPQEEIGDNKADIAALNQKRSKAAFYINFLPNESKQIRELRRSRNPDGKWNLHMIAPDKFGFLPVETQAH